VVKKNEKEFQKTNFEETIASINHFLEIRNKGSMLSKNDSVLIFTMMDTNKMYKFSDTKPKAEVVNEYYQKEQIQINLMQLVSENNLHNEMILKFIK
jgi:hypothetical protein